VKHDHLARVKDWVELARAANYRAEHLAGRCGVSLREMERFFQTRTGMTPHEWLNRLRQMQALEFLAGDKSVKATAIELGYIHPAHFSRDFKRFHGLPPSALEIFAETRPVLTLRMPHLG
jgi:transcriptional regulator GlxA family with amidase domain